MSELYHFFHRRWVELLVAGVWLQSVVGAALAQDWALLAVAGLGGLALLAAVFWLVERLRQRRTAPVGVGEAFKLSRRGLVVIVGGQKNTALFVIESQRPEWIGLLCSRQSEALADEVIDDSRLGGERTQKEIVDAWDIVDVRDKVETLLKWLTRKGLSPGEMAVDITGGTTPMSVGAFMLAEQWGVDTQYVRSQYDAQNKPVPKTQEGLLISRHSAAGS